MSTNRQIEIFSAGCPLCQDTIDLVNRLACVSCEVTVLELRRDDVVRRAKQLGVRSVPAVAINGTVVDCCVGRGPDESTLRAAGLGQP